MLTKELEKRIQKSVPVKQYVPTKDVKISIKEIYGTDYPIVMVMTIPSSVYSHDLNIRDFLIALNRSFKAKIFNPELAYKKTIGVPRNLNDIIYAPMSIAEAFNIDEAKDSEASWAKLINELMAKHRVSFDEFYDVRAILKKFNIKVNPKNENPNYSAYSFLFNNMGANRLDGTDLLKLYDLLAVYDNYKKGVTIPLPWKVIAKTFKVDDNFAKSNFYNFLIDYYMYKGEVSDDVLDKYAKYRKTYEGFDLIAFLLLTLVKYEDEVGKVSNEFMEGIDKYFYVDKS